VIDSCRVLHISVYVEDFLYPKEGSERGLKIGKIIKAQQPEVYKQLKKERKENLSSNYIEKLMENNKGVDEKKCR
jgi:hypothetical protein